MFNTLADNLLYPGPQGDKQTCKRSRFILYYQICRDVKRVRFRKVRQKRSLFRCAKRSSKSHFETLVLTLNYFNFQGAANHRLFVLGIVRTVLAMCYCHPRKKHSHHDDVKQNQAMEVTYWLVDCKHQVLSLILLLLVNIRSSAYTSIKWGHALFSVPAIWPQEIRSPTAIWKNTCFECWIRLCSVSDCRFPYTSKMFDRNLLVFNYGTIFKLKWFDCHNCRAYVLLLLK